jgi:hypothetical protein
VTTIKDENVQTMTPPYGYTKLGGKNGIAILKKMYQLNKQIMALTDDLKISTNVNANPNLSQQSKQSKQSKQSQSKQSNTKEGFMNQAKNEDAKGKDKGKDMGKDKSKDMGNDIDKLSELSKKLKKDEAKLNETIKAQQGLDTDEIQSKQLLLYSRIKLGVAVVLGLFMGYLAYRFLTAENDLPEAIQAEMGSPTPSIPATPSIQSISATPSIQSIPSTPSATPSSNVGMSTYTDMNMRSNVGSGSTT